MIINFSIQNFGSIKDKQTLSFEADKSDHLEDSYVIHTHGLRLLKMALIFGANASGKTTILNALEFIRNMVLQPLSKKTDTLSFLPFLFDEETPHLNTFISIEFIADDTRYHYELEFFQQAVIKEVLHFYHPKKANVYTRTTDLQNQLTKIKFGSKIKIDKTVEKNLEAYTLWNNTVLGGFLKTNVDVKELKVVTHWFEYYLSPLVYSKTDMERTITSLIAKGDISKSDVITILKKAGFHISDIILQEVEEVIPDSFIEIAKKTLKLTDDEIRGWEERGTIPLINLEFEYTINQSKYTLPDYFESQGLNRFYCFAGILTLLMKGSRAITIDVLEFSLHPDLYNFFLLSFLLNSNKSQIIATTHFREFLDNKDIFRNDAIWFTDKSENGYTELYSLADFDSSVIRNTTNIYNAYKSGKLKAAPHVTDSFFDLK